MVDAEAELPKRRYQAELGCKGIVLMIQSVGARRAIPAKKMAGKQPTGKHDVPLWRKQLHK
jgi:hypothetical protein